MPPKTNKGKSKGKAASKGKAVPKVGEQRPGVEQGKTGPSRRKGKAAASGEEPPLEATRDYRCFVVDVNNFSTTYKPLTVEIEEELVKILTNDSPADKNGNKSLQKIKGKLYTPKGGCFLVQLRPGLNSQPSEWVTLMYRWKDLYFEAFHAQGKWFLLSDAEEALPPRSQLAWGKKKHWKQHLVKLAISSSHGGMGGCEIQIGPIACKKYYRSLLKADELINQGKISDEVYAVGVEPWVPEEHSIHFTEWGKYSIRMVYEDKPLEEELANRLFIIKTMSEPPKQSATQENIETSSSNSKGRGDESGLGQGNGQGDNGGGSSQGDGHGLGHDDEGSNQHAQPPSQAGQAKTFKHNGEKYVQNEIQFQLKTVISKTKLAICEGEDGPGTIHRQEAIGHLQRELMGITMVKQKRALELSNLINGSKKSLDETGKDGASCNPAAARGCCQSNGGLTDLPKEKQDKSVAAEQNEKGSEKENDKESCAGSKKGHTNTCQTPAETWERADTYVGAVSTAAASVFVAFRISLNLTENLRSGAPELEIRST